MVATRQLRAGFHRMGARARGLAWAVESPTASWEEHQLNEQGKDGRAEREDLELEDLDLITVWQRSSLRKMGSRADGTLQLLVLSWKEFYFILRARPLPR